MYEHITYDGLIKRMMDRALASDKTLTAGKVPCCGMGKPPPPWSCRTFILPWIPCYRKLCRHSKPRIFDFEG